MTEQLRVQALHVRRGGREILRGIDLQVDTGEVCVLMGASGAGKSTILRAIAALEPFEAGSISVGDFVLSPGPIPPQSALRALRGRVGMVFQAHALFEHLTVLENLTLAPMYVHGSSREAADALALRLLDDLGIADRADALPRRISGGEAQRAAIARALVLDPQYLLMDEPTAALDPARRTSLAETLRSLARQGRGILIATHDGEFARMVADRTCYLADGLVGRPTSS
ncbi:MAG: ATP-binding cassette domain-containing protein [Longimicrobiales bacterium]